MSLVRVTAMLAWLLPMCTMADPSSDPLEHGETPPPPAVLVVTVFDSEREPLRGVEIAVKQADAAPFRALTDRAGVARFSGLRAGQAQVWVIAPGFEPASQAITLAEQSAAQPLGFALVRRLPPEPHEAEDSHDTAPTAGAATTESASR